MDSETPVVKYIAGAAGIILVCFCLGYFVLGPRTRPEVTLSPTAATPEPASPSPLTVSTGGPPALTVDETTAQKEAARKKAEEEAKKKADEAAQKKALEDAQKAEEAAAKAATPQPAESPLPTGDGTGASDNSSSSEPGKEPGGESSGATLYRVRLDRVFDSREEADALARELQGRNLPTTIVSDASSGKYQIQVGSFRERKRAEDRLNELKNNGYDASIRN